MANQSRESDAAETMRRLNQAWRDGRIDDMAPMVHPDVVMVLPGFAGRVGGREKLLAGFRDFTESATLHEFRELEQQTDIVGRTAVTSVSYEMVYERDGGRYRATGRDVWVFESQGDAWLAVWRTMLDADEVAA